ncbi:MAG: UDP-glucose:undecaprenyl-phosphate glucose-1-phosphate transferase [Polaribacter sejongensis]|nr:MAG: UDP-glucose:undecaprenyl-phosphate glucose-1-phosphate transferase [Polaribacter sejongensis]
MKPRYSFLIKPINIIIDILIINIIVYFIKDRNYINLSFLLYVNLVWLLTSYYTNYYKVYRTTGGLKILNLIFGQFSIFILSFFTFFSLFREGYIINKQFVSLSLILGSLFIAKFISLYFLKTYRRFGNNFRNVIVFGSNKSAKNVANLFIKRQDLGYRFTGFFSDKESKETKYLGTITDGLLYLEKDSIDEIYCEVNSISRQQHKELRQFCNTHKIDFNLIPENKAIYSKKFELEYYGTLPILKRRKLPFEMIETHIIKRIFDILFSIIICVFLLSWLLPILWVIVKIDSKGAFFFKQIRDGVDGKQFCCYKIRSMKTNSLSHKISATKNDKRITKIGAFLRKTSLDELPQFFNVLKGDMSVIGPRPHMNIQTEKYLKEIDHYIVRNSVKPGITGLAQVSGYRGEVQKKSDIENRVRLDVFYIENWSFFLDIKIIFQTLISVFKGEEKAY